MIGSRAASSALRGKEKQSEVKHGDKFDEARVELLTGGDRIKARRMRQDFFSFEPTHKLWLLGNHRPEVGTGGFAF